MKVVVSLTSIFDNLRRLENVLKSLLQQTMKPDAIVVFLSIEPYLMDKGFPEYRIPTWLDEMVEVRWVKNNGPYRKLLPLLKEMWDEDVCIITCDDDTVYSKDFVKNLVVKYKEEGCCVAYRCKYWSPGSSYNEMKAPVNKDILNFHTGKGGVLYHPKMFHGTDVFSSKFLKLCPTNDDIWFNFWRMKAGIECLYLPDEYMYVDMINPPFALWNNYNQYTNDEQMKNTFDFIFSK